MEKIIFGKEVLDYFDNLVFTLFEKDYFGFPESAENYVNNISEFVFSNIYTFPHKKTPKSLKHLGSEYIFYKSNSRTTCYIFLKKEIKII